MGNRPRRYRLPASARVRSKRDFGRVFSLRKRIGCAWMVLYANPNGMDRNRLGISVGHRYGNAVRRNRIKRLIREAFRHVRHELPTGVDWIVVPRQSDEPTVAELRETLIRLADKLANELQLTQGKRKHQVP